MVSRPLIIVLALGAAAFRLSQGFVIESVGLFGLGAGLLVLRLAAKRPAITPLAYLGFLTTAVSIALVLMRNSR